MATACLARITAALLAVFVCVSFYGAADAALFKTKKKTKPTEVSIEQRLGRIVDDPSFTQEKIEIGPVYFDLVVRGLCLVDGLKEDPKRLAPGAKRYETAGRDYAEAAEKVTARVIALNVKVNPIDPGKEPVLVPLLAAANRKGEAKERVSACNNFIAKNIPVGRPLTMTFEVYITSKKEFSAHIGIIGTEIATLAGSIAPLTGSAEFVAAGATIGAVSKAGTSIAQSVERLINHFIKFKADPPRTRTYTMTQDITAISMTSGKDLKIVIEKQFKPSQVKLTIPGNVNELPQAFDAAFGPQAMNNATVTPAIQGLLGKPVTDDNFKTLCQELRFNIGKAGPTATNDTVAELFGLYWVTHKNAAYFDNSNRTCFTEGEARLLTKEQFAVPPHKGAFDFSRKPTEKAPDKPVRIEEFPSTSELLSRLATVLKRAPFYLDPAKPDEAKASRAAFAEVLASEIAVAGESLDLLPERKAPNAEVVDLIIKWGAVTRFGCFRPPVSQTAIDQKVTAEALFLIPGRRILGVMQIGYDGTVNRLNMLKVFRADADNIKRLSAPDGKCGSADGWEPMKDF